HPTNTVHWFRHDEGMLVHVTPHNALMWDSPHMQSCVIEHGVVAPSTCLYTGQLARGITAINHLSKRGRRVGADLYEWMAGHAPLDLIGMGSEDLNGLGEIPNMEVSALMARYRFFFSPIRYASLGLSLVEAMMVGMPIVGIAATELPNVITNGVNGWVDSLPKRLIDCMHRLIDEPTLARRWGEAAREEAILRFSIERFIDDWNRLLGVMISPSYSGVVA